jgi:hypothetical protein
MFRKKEGKWTEVPYVHLFFFLRDHPEWLRKCRLHTKTMLTLCKKPPNSLQPKNSSDAPSAPSLPPYSATLHNRCHPTRLYPLQLIPGGDRYHISFIVSELKKKGFRKLHRKPRSVHPGFREVSQNFELSWKDVILLLS